MPTDSANHEAPTEGSAPPDAGTRQDAPDAGTAVPTDVPVEATVPDDAVEAAAEPAAPEAAAEAAPEPAAEVAPEAAAEAAPEPAAEVAPEPVAEAAPEPAAPEPVAEAAPEPAAEAAAPESAAETAPEPAAPEPVAEAGPEPAAEAAAPESAAEAVPAAPRRPPAERGPARDAGPPRGGQRRPPRPPGAPPLRSRGDGPGVPMPEHHHLPGWVRRAHAKARPELAELLGSLQGAPRAQFLAKLEALVATISSGKFSSAWQYPEVIAEGRALQETQRAHMAEAAKASRQLDSLRRRASDRLRDAADLLAPDAAARLQRALRSANDEQSIAAVESEAIKALSTARSASNKRRDREIERTRARINRSLPRSALEAESPTETWQDVLRRFAEEQSASTGAGG
ncbi:MAG: hypothetical protein QOE72_2916 [Chloroflexota bacterium]|nr:hypothetical protein [Chloroflexota bacterium]